MTPPASKCRLASPKRPLAAGGWRLPEGYPDKVQDRDSHPCWPLERPGDDPPAGPGGEGLPGLRDGEAVASGGGPHPERATLTSRTQLPPTALPGVPRRAGVLPCGRRARAAASPGAVSSPTSPAPPSRLCGGPPDPLAADSLRSAPPGRLRFLPRVASRQASPCRPSLQPRGHLCPRTRIPWEGLRRRVHTGPKHTPLVDSAGLGLAPVGCGAATPSFPTKGIGLQEPQPGWPWVWPGQEEMREPGLGRRPWGLRVSSSRPHSPGRGSMEGVFQAGKGRSRCVPDVSTCSRKRKTAVQRPSPHPAVRQSRGPGMEVQFLPLLPWFQPTLLSVTSFLHLRRMWPARPSPGASVLRASGQSGSWRLQVGCRGRNTSLEPSPGLPPVMSWGPPITLSTLGLPGLPACPHSRPLVRTRLCPGRELRSRQHTHGGYRGRSGRRGPSGPSEAPHPQQRL